MKTCKIESCSKKYFGLGYCRNHYVAFKKYGNALISKRRKRGVVCKIENCKRKYYAVGYCRKHYWDFIYYPTHKEQYKQYQKKYRLEKYGIGAGYKTCDYLGCKNRTYKNHSYCGYHVSRIKSREKSGLPIDLSVSCSLKGNRNPNWKGGVFAYPNHYEMKKNRLLVLERAKGVCEICGKVGKHIHHKDQSKNNHSLENLILLCVKCHGLVHEGRNNKTSKFIRIYGHTMKEISLKLNISLAMVYNLHRKNELKNSLTINKKPLY